jgi:GNAT superfamily N-acetyltransferase
MTNIRIREADPQRDYPRIAELLSQVETQPITADTLHEWDARVMEGQIRRRMVAVDAAGTVVAYTVIIHMPWKPADDFFIQVVVDSARRRQGIGGQFYEAALRIASETYGMTVIDSEVREDCPEGLHFAERRGFHIAHHSFESTIDLATFDERPFAGTIEQVEASGIRLLSLADAGDTRENRFKLWDVNYRTYLDDPGSDGAFPNFEEFLNIWETSSWFRPDGQIMAFDGEQCVGLSAVGYFAGDNSAYNMMTGVLAAYRGRGIAQALKLRSIRAAKDWGAAFIRAHNDSNNGPMLAINRKLGYVPQPGVYRLVNDLKEA